ncbi:MAG: zinc ribbon domain-containing protein [Actinobacteria bacterium]|nr:zinc ribbon domain-containing protein [Actinomycetota bacterium]
MTFCAECGTQAEAGQRFCLECGDSLEQQTAAPATAAYTVTPLVCPACASPLEEHDSFCQSCGAAAGGAPPAETACHLCGAPARPGEAFCDGCLTQAYQPQAASYGGGWTAAPYAEYPHASYAQPAVWQPPARNRRPWLVAGIMLAVLAAAGGATAAALVLTGEEEEPVAAQVRPVAEDGDRTPEPPAEEPSDDDSQGSSGAPQVPEGFFTERGEEAFDEPAETMRTHWSYIAAGNYEAAYDTFVASYSADRSRWIAGQEDNAARVAGVTATTVSSNADIAEVEVSVTTRDAGRGDQSCNYFSGLVRLERYSGVWRYGPRPPEDDPSFFQRREAGISSSEPTCAQTFD